MQYHASNLTDIADWFEERASNAMKRQVEAKPRDGALLAREAVTWRAAAEFIRNCHIKAKD